MNGVIQILFLRVSVHFQRKQLTFSKKNEIFVKKVDSITEFQLNANPFEQKQILEMFLFTFHYVSHFRYGQLQKQVIDHLFAKLQMSTFCISNANAIHKYDLALANTFILFSKHDYASSKTFLKLLKSTPSRFLQIFKGILDHNL